MALFYIAGKKKKGKDRSSSRGHSANPANTNPGDIMTSSADKHVTGQVAGSSLQQQVSSSTARSASGGTWPRSRRGGPVIDQGTGTILHPQKVKKERLPLAELLNNLPKYPPGIYKNL